MTRSILLANVPCLIALAIAFGLLWMLKRGSGAKWNWKRLRELHRCQEGGVQSLAFVLTLPIFLVIMMFIVQVSQLMVGITMVHYSAFAAARSAIVWLPAHVSEDEPENRLLLDSPPREIGSQFYVVPSDNSVKFRHIRQAAILGLAPIAPSRDLGIPAGNVSAESQRTIAAAQRMYRSLVPSSAGNRRIDPRIANKIAYADRNTIVVVSWRDINAGRGRETLAGRATYNPRNHPNPAVVWEPGEVGWQDAVTIHVAHRFALIPGPGRLLAKHLVPSSGIPDEVYRKIRSDRDRYSEPVYSVLIPASATLPNEGMKSVRPYEQN